VVIIPLAIRGKLERVNRKLKFPKPGTAEDPIVIDDEKVDLTKVPWTEEELLAFTVDDDFLADDSDSYVEDSINVDSEDVDYDYPVAHSLDEEEVAEVMSDIE